MARSSARYSRMDRPNRRRNKAHSEDGFRKRVYLTTMTVPRCRFETVTA